MGMNTNTQPAVVGVFQDRAQAERAINELHSNGFTDDQIGFAVRNGQQTQGTVATGSTDTGPDGGRIAGDAVTGGVIGGIIGAGAALLIPGVGPAIAGGILAATLGGAALGAAAGGIVGALTDIGVSEEDARYYQGEFEQGRTIVTVQADNRAQLAQDILRRNGAYNAQFRVAGNTAYGTSGATTSTTTTTNAMPQANAYSTSATPGAATDWNTVAPSYRNSWQQQYGKSRGRWEDYEPGYRYGWQMANNPQYMGRDWAQVEPEFRRNWETTNPSVPWNQVSSSVRQAWDSERTAANQGSTFSTYNQQQ
jgi:hypothetical protein